MHPYLKILYDVCETSPSHCFFLTKPTFADRLAKRTPFSIGHFADYSQHNLILLRDGQIIDALAPNAGAIPLAAILDIIHN